MRLNIAEKSKAANRRGMQPDGADIAEIFRQEISARSVCLRRLLIEQVRNSLLFRYNYESPALLELCDELIESGDILEGANGWLAAAPVRLIEITEARWRLVGAVSTLRAAQYGTVSVCSEGMIRYLEEPDATSLNAFVEAGARVVTRETWAGLSNVAPAGKETVDEVMAAIDAYSLQPAGEHADYPQPWLKYTPAKGKNQLQRWGAPKEPPGPSLWRTFNVWKKPVFAWTNGLSPRDANWLRLGRDQTIRLQFALDRAEGLPLTISTEVKKKQIIVEIAAWLPRAELRYLQIMGLWQPPEPARKTHKFEFSPEAWPAVKSMLAERLGIESGD